MARYLNQRFGDYQLIRLLGEGGFAEVYEARQVHLGTSVAIKILKDAFTPAQIEALRQEALIVSRLDHPHVVRLLNFSIERGIPYIVMSYAPGGSLDKQAPRRSLPMSARSQLASNAPTISGSFTATSNPPTSF